MVKFASRLLCTSAIEQETGPATDMVQMLQRIGRCFISQGNQVSILRSSSTYPILYKLSYHKPPYKGMENNYKKNRQGRRHTEEWADNIKKCLKERVCKAMDRINLAQKRV